MKKIVLSAMLLLALLTLAGCRTRTAAARTGAGGQAVENLPSAQTEAPANGDAQTGDPAANSGEADEEPSAATTLAPDAARRVYDENASAEVVPGSIRVIDSEAEGDGHAARDAEADTAADLTDPRGDRTATQTVTAEETDRMGTDADAPEADSRLTYYTVLLQERTGSLFECKRQYVYWEQPEDYRTVFKNSQEHLLILRTGCYDVSARLLEENLTVTDGWVVRKDPGVIVKVVDTQVLGFGVSDQSAARKICDAIMSRPGWSGIDAVKHGRVVLISSDLLRSPHTRMAAMLIIAQTALPEVFADLELDTAINDLLTESAGTPAGGLLYYMPVD